MSWAVLLLNEVIIIITFIYLYVLVRTPTCLQHVCGRQRTTWGVISLLLPCGSQGLNTGRQAW